MNHRGITLQIKMPVSLNLRPFSHTIKEALITKVDTFHNLHNHNLNTASKYYG